MRLWDAATGKHKTTLTRHSTSVLSLAYSPDGGIIATAGSEVHFWDAVTGQFKASLIGHTGDVWSLAYSPDGSMLVTGISDKTVRLWNAVTRTHKATFIGHEDYIWSVSFSPDSKTVASASRDGTVRLWDVVSGTQKTINKGHLDGVNGVCFSPGGRVLASGSEDGSVLLWNVDGSKPRVLRQSLLTHHESSERQIAVQRPPQQIAETALSSTVLVVMEDTDGQPLSSGSGFFVERGMIATNLHVVEGVFKGYVKRVGADTKHRIEGIVAMNSQQDLAILRVSDIGSPILPLGNSDKLQVGEPVYAVGNPKGYLEGTFTEGVVSGVREFQIGVRRIQISAQISGGSSGGPVLNSSGEVIGVAVSKLTEGQNLNFAIPSNYLKELLSKAGVHQ